MALVISEETGSTKTPWVDAPKGMHNGVLCDVQDLGMVENKQYSKMQHKCLVMFQLGTRITAEDEGATEDNIGKRHLISKRFTLTLDDRGQLLPFIQTMLDRDLTPEERKGGFDLESLIGTNALIQVIKRPDQTDPNKIWTNIQNCIPNPSKSDHIEIEDYTPKSQRTDGDAPPAQAPVGKPVDPLLATQKARYGGLLSLCRDLGIKTRELPEGTKADPVKFKKANDQLQDAVDKKKAEFAPAPAALEDDGDDFDPFDSDED